MSTGNTAANYSRERATKIGSLARRIKHLAWLGDVASCSELVTTSNNVELCEALWVLVETVGETAGRIEDLAEEIEFPDRGKEACHGAGA